MEGQKPERHGKDFTIWEDRLIREALAAGGITLAIRWMPTRTPASVRNRARKLKGMTPEEADAIRRVYEHRVMKSAEAAAEQESTLWPERVTCGTCKRTEVGTRARDAGWSLDLERLCHVCPECETAYTTAKNADRTSKDEARKRERQKRTVAKRIKKLLDRDKRGR